MLVEDTKIYEVLANGIKKYFACMGDMYFNIHAIYEPDEYDDLHAGKYHAAVDLYEEGLTYHCWFIVNDDGSITGDALERWYIG